MKKIILFFVIIVIIIVIFINRYLIYIDEYNIVQIDNSQFDSYYGKEILGSELVTIINKIVDQNTRNNIELDLNNEFIDNNQNSILMDIKFVDSDVTCKMELFYNSRNY